MKIGYARVSTKEQNLDLQLDALQAAGCTTIYQDEGSGGTVKERAGLSQALEALGAKDILVVWKLDRLGRSLGFLCSLIEELGKQKTGFISLTDGIDTATSGGKLVFHIMGALAEFERGSDPRADEGWNARRPNTWQACGPSTVPDSSTSHPCP